MPFQCKNVVVDHSRPINFYSCSAWLLDTFCGETGMKLVKDSNRLACAALDDMDSC